MPVKIGAHPVLFKIFVREFYRQNTGFIWLMLFVGLVLTPGRAHLQLARMAAYNPAFLWLFFGPLWAFYALKVQIFVRKAWQKPENEICYLLACFSRRDISRQWIVVQAGLMAPVLAWAAFLIEVMATEQQFAAVSGVLFLCLILHLTLLYDILGLIFHPNTGPLRIFQVPDFSWPEWGFGSFLYLRRLLHEGKGIAFLTKTLSVFLIWGVCRLFYTDQYDSRLVSLGLLFSGGIHTGIMQFWQRMDFKENLWIRNLPLSLGERFIQWSFACILISLPEMVLLSFRLPDAISPDYLPGSALFFTGIIAYSFHFQYYKPPSPEAPPTHIMAVIFVMALLIMYGCPLWIPGAELWAVSAYFFWRYYHRAEWKPEEPPEDD